MSATESKRTFSDEMRVRLKDIEARAKAAGSNMTQVCKKTEIARATFERWSDRPPQSVRKLDELEAEVCRIEEEHRRAQSAAAAAQ